MQGSKALSHFKQTVARPIVGMLRIDSFGDELPIYCRERNVCRVFRVLVACRWTDSCCYGGNGKLRTCWPLCRFGTDVALTRVRNGLFALSEPCTALCGCLGESLSLSLLESVAVTSYFQYPIIYHRA